MARSASEVLPSAGFLEGVLSRGRALAAASAEALRAAKCALRGGTSGGASNRSGAAQTGRAQQQPLPRSAGRPVRTRAARSLASLTIDLGGERRTLVGGLAKSYGPRDLLGLKVVVATNLEPARIRGVLSEGMLLGVGCQDGTSIGLLTVNRPVANGARVQ